MRIEEVTEEKKVRPHKSTIELMRVNSADELEHMHPRVACHKCGKMQWMMESAPLTWGCLCCGNLVYLELGAPVQQIDIVRKMENGLDE